MSKLRIVFIILFAGIFLFAAYQLLGIFGTYHKDETVYAEARDGFKTDYEPAAYTPADEAALASALPEAITALNTDFSAYEHEVSSLRFMHTFLDYVLLPRYVFDFERLQTINSEVIGWIVIEDTEIDYPVVQAADNEKYIRTGLDGNEHNAGCIFADHRNQTPFWEKNTILYGHNQKNHKMFHDLVKFLDADFALTHPYFTVYLCDGTVQTWEVAASFLTDSASDVYQVDFYEGHTFADHINYIMPQSKVDFGVHPREDQIFLTLSTCTNENENDRYVVIARLVSISQK